VAQRTHPNHRHHIHNVQDARELLGQMGFTVDETKVIDNENEIVVESTEQTTGTLNPSTAAWIKLTKSNGQLTITDNTK
jgi:hypothetical protein